jgi:hypothetical protein
MNDELKKRMAKKLVRLKAEGDSLWAMARDARKRIEAAISKQGTLTTEDITILRLAGGIVVSQLLINETDVNASKYLTPDEENEYGGPNA